MKLSLSLVALLVCGTAQASDWVEIWHMTGAVMVDYLDVSRLQFAGDIRSGWLKVVITVPANIGVEARKASGTGRYVKEMMGHKTYDCRQETVRLDSAARYFSDGTSDSKYIPDALFEPVLPDTLEEAEMKLICGLKPPVSHQ
jgi:hypothetical protein